MAFNINDIRSAVNKYDSIHRPSHFYVRIFPPSFLGGDSYTTDIEYLCDATNLPGLHFDTSPVKPLGYGTSELRPYDAVFNPVRCDFFVDNKNEFFRFFHKWMGNINNFGTDYQRASNQTSLNYYEFAYPKEYEGTIEIHLFNGEGKNTTSTQLLKAFPTDISDLGLAWEMNDTISRISVTFAYNTFDVYTLPFNAQARQIGQRVQTLRNNLTSYTPSLDSQPTLPAINTNGQNRDGSFIGLNGTPAETPVFQSGA